MNNLLRILGNCIPAFLLLFAAHAFSSHASAQPSKRLFHDYGNVRSNAEKAALDGYFLELQNSPDERGYAVVFAPARQTARRAAFIQSYMKERGMDSSRITIIRRTAKTISTQLWVVPPGADPPR